MRRILFVLIAFLGVMPLACAGDNAEAVKKAVLGPQEAGWARHDFKEYMTQWADDAKIVGGRHEQAGKHDLVLDRKQIESTRRLLMHGKPAADHKVTFADVQVKVDKDEAELRVRTTRHFGKDYMTFAEVYRLRKTPAGWKVYLNRAWTLKTKFAKEIAYDAAMWQKLDEAADELLRNDTRGDQAAQALDDAWRPREAYTLLKQVTARKDATANDWVHRGWTALTTGDAADSVLAFRTALKLDEKAAVPEFAREKK